MRREDLNSPKLDNLWIGINSTLKKVQTAFIGNLNQSFMLYLPDLIKIKCIVQSLYTSLSRCSDKINYQQNVCTE
mgnify:FL=1